MNTISFNSHSTLIFECIISLSLSLFFFFRYKEERLEFRSFASKFCSLSTVPVSPKEQKELMLFLTLWRKAGKNSVPGSRKAPVTLQREKDQLPALHSPSPVEMRLKSWCFCLRTPASFSPSVGIFLVCPREVTAVLQNRWGVFQSLWLSLRS